MSERVTSVGREGFSETDLSRNLGNEKEASGRTVRQGLRNLRSREKGCRGCRREKQR
jgi:hypothetical protein